MNDSLKENTKRIKNANRKDTEIKNIFCFHFLRILMGQAKKGDLNIVKSTCNFIGNKLNNISAKFGRTCFNGFWEIFAAILPKIMSAILKW